MIIKINRFTGRDEMCNFYMMYYTKNKKVICLFVLMLQILILGKVSIS